MNFRKQFMATYAPDVAITLTNLAGVYMETDRFDLALETLEDAHEVSRELWGEDHPKTLDILYNQAAIANVQGDLDKGEELMETILPLTRSRYGNENIQVARILNGLGIIVTRKKEYAKAVPYLRESLEIRQAVLTDDHWMTGNSKVQLGATLTFLDRYAEAESLLIDGFKTLRIYEGDSSRYTLSAKKHIEDLYKEWNKPGRIDSVLQITAPPQ